MLRQKSKNTQLFNTHQGSGISRDLISRVLSNKKSLPKKESLSLAVIKNYLIATHLHIAYGKKNLAITVCAQHNVANITKVFNFFGI